MNKVKVVIILLLFSMLCLNVFAQNNNYPFEVQKKGSGNQSIIFIPGFACSGKVWDGTTDIFDRKYVCYTLTMAGFAGVKPQSTATFANWEKGIVQYIKDNQIEKPILIGHSMGGALALAIAADFPDLIGGIVVVDALPCLSAVMNPDFKPKENNDCTEVVKRLTAMNDEQFYQMQKMSIPRLLADTSKQAEVISWSVKSDRRTFAEMYCDFSNIDLRDKIKNIQCPSLILLEAYFSNIKPEIEQQYKNLKTADLHYANKGLHFVMYDDREWYLDQLKNISIAD